MSDHIINKVETPRGDGARLMTPLLPNSLTVSFDQSGAEWMGPSSPLAPLAPPQVAGRLWDFPVGYNLNTTPRPYEEFSFESLRSLADSYDVIRLVIEARKNQLCRLLWQVRVRSDGGKRPAKAQTSPETQARIDDVTDLFRKPSHNRSLRSFTREFLEDVFTIDNACIFLRRDPHSRRVIGWSNIDGATIRKVIDPWGREPEPVPIDAGPLPEHFHRLGYTVHSGVAWPVIAQQTLKGLPAISYTALDLITRPFNPRPGHGYGLSCVEQVATTVSIAMRRQHSQLEYYREGNAPAGILGLPDTMSVDQVAQFQSWWDSLFVGNLGRRRQIRFMVGNGKFQPLHEPPIKSEADEWLARVVAFCFSYPATPFVNLSNRSIAESHEKQSEEEGLEPLKQYIKEIYDEIIHDHLGHDDLEFAWAESDEVDTVNQSEVLDRYVSGGIMTRNEARDRLGLDRDPSPDADKLSIKTATGCAKLGAANNSTKETAQNV